MAIEAKNATTHSYEAAVEKLRRLRQSPRYWSFLSLEAIDAFAKVEPSALAGESLPFNKRRDSLNKE